jgi:hypothetical protein
VNASRIDFISDYCDRWCERCAFTSRCSLFAAEAAIAMCGDVSEGLELAVGAPPRARPGPASRAHAWDANLENVELTPDESAAFERRERERSARVRGTSAVKVADHVAVLAYRWLSASADNLRATADEMVVEALDIAFHDAFLVTVKLHRALDGRDRHEHGDDDDDHPIQNDWNGSAKVALVCIERSETAWRIIAHATGQDTPAAIADQLRDLEHHVERTFPRARAFIRPGFDEPEVHPPAGR